jgi:arylsulfatase A-like enzyme
MEIDRRRFLRLLGAGAAASVLPRRLEAGEARGSGQPNIIFIMSDDHACQAIGSYGSVINATPNIDRLAAEGVRFERCFVTNSICAPSRAVILTGKYNHICGMRTNRDTFDPAQQTFPKLLRQAGYQTAVVGKWHLRDDPAGFDYWKVLKGQGHYYQPVLKDATGENQYTGYVTDIITDVALDWLKNRRDLGKPFMLMFHHKAPHRDWQPGLGHLTLYDGVTIPEPVTLFDDYSTRGTAARAQEMTIAQHLNDSDLKLKYPGRLTSEQLQAWKAAYDAKNQAFLDANLTGDDLVRWKYQRYIKDYLRCIASVDESIGRLLDHLDQSGLAANTVVVYTSDQGFYLGEHGWFDKRFMYEESLRTPLLIRWPGVVAPGSVSRDIALNLDFAETFLDVAGVPVPGDMQGRSLVPVLGGATPADWRRSMYYRYYEYPGTHSVHQHYGVRTERYKLICFHELDEWELYDLDADRHELNNLYSDPAYRDVVKSLKAELWRLRVQFRDTDVTRTEIDRLVRDHMNGLADDDAVDAAIKSWRTPQ